MKNRNYFLIFGTVVLLMLAGSTAWYLYEQDRKKKLSAMVIAPSEVSGILSKFKS